MSFRLAAFALAPLLVGLASPRLAFACAGDAECPPTAWCREGGDAGAGACAPKTPNGELVPGGECDGELAARACVSGVCDYVSSLCGVPIGDDCGRDAECTGGVCVQDARDAGADASTGGVCRECRATSDCAGKGALRVCDPSDGRCAACVTDADCGGDAPVCDRAVRSCVPAKVAGPRDGGTAPSPADASPPGEDGSAAAVGPEVPVGASGGCATAGGGSPGGLTLAAAAAVAALAAQKVRRARRARPRNDDPRGR